MYNIINNINNIDGLRNNISISHFEVFQILISLCSKDHFHLRGDRKSKSRIKIFSLF